MTGYDAEAKMREHQERADAKFRDKHKVTWEEWQLAEAMTCDTQRHFHALFWEVYDRANGIDDGRRGAPTIPGNGMETEMRTADGPAEKAARPHVRGNGRRAKKQRNR